MRYGVWETSPRSILLQVEGAYISFRAPLAFRYSPEARRKEVQAAKESRTETLCQLPHVPHHMQPMRGAE